MRIEKIIIGEGNEFTPESFSGENFKDALEKECIKLGKKGDPAWDIANRSYGILQKINTPKKLTLQEAITLCCLETKIKVKIIGERGEDTPDKETLSQLTTKQMIDLILSSEGEEDFNGRIKKLTNAFFRENQEESDLQIRLKHTIPNTHYGIFEAKDGNGSTYYISHKKANGVGEGVIVDTNGFGLSKLKKGEHIYGLIQVGSSVEIWGGSIRSGIIQIQTLPNTEISDIDILYPDIVGIMKGDEFLIQDMQTGKEYLNMRMNDFAGFTDNGKAIDVHMQHGKYVFIYRGFNDEGEVAYIATDDDLDDDCFSSRYPIHPIITPNGVYLTMYSPEANLYALTSMTEVMVSTIVAFIDENDNHYIGGHFPESIKNPQGRAELRFVYYGFDEKDNKEYDIGYVFDGIVGDKESKKEKPTISITIPSANDLPI